MEAIKKKLASLKDEKDSALERVEEVEREKKETEARAEAVGNRDVISTCMCIVYDRDNATVFTRFLCLSLHWFFFFPSFSGFSPRLCFRHR